MKKGAQRGAAFSPPHGFDSEIGQQNLAEASYRALNLQHRLGNHLEERYQLGITALDLTAPEYLWASRQLLLTASASVGPVAATNAWASLSGAAGVLTVVERITIASSNAGPLTCLLGLVATLTPGGGSTLGQSRDSRAAANPAVGLGSAVLSYGTSAAAVSPPRPVNLFVGYAPVVLEGEWVLTGGAILSAVMFALNTNLCITFDYRERPLLPSEL